MSDPDFDLLGSSFVPWGQTIHHHNVDLTLQNANGIPIWTTNSLLDEKSREEIAAKIAEGKYRTPILHGMPPIEILPHDGKLDEDAYIAYGEIRELGFKQGLRLFNGSAICNLTAKQALSLLLWLLQERPHLEELAGVMSVEDLTEGN